MPTYLLTWNPNSYEWEDLEQCIAEVEEFGSVTMRWSVGNTKRIQSGDRFFLVQLGTLQKGILGSGYFLSSPTYGPHWSGESGREALYCEIEFNALIKPPRYLLSFTTLQTRFPSVNWTPQASGVSLPELVANDLEILGEQGSSAAQNQKVFLEGTLRRVLSNRRERSAKAREACLEHYGYDCVVCGFNFEAFYGESGKGLIQVHHLAPLGAQNEKTKTDPIRDLRPVCANCHAVIHRHPTPYTVEEMHRKLKR